MNKRWLLIGAAAVAISNFGWARAYAEEKEENEQKISFKEAPKDVRKTFKREANGEEIKTVDKEKLNGKTVYEADVEIDDHNYEIVVDKKGLLLSKKLDNEDEEKSQAKSKKSEKGEDEDEAKPQAKKSEKEEDEDKSAKTQKQDKDDDDDKPAKAQKQDKDDDEKK